MNNIAAFTQTYGDDRKQVFDYRKLDKHFVRFINNFDFNLLSFHNSSKSFQNYVLEHGFYKNYIELNNISYSQSLLHNLLLLKHQGINKVFFYQDDVFSIQKNELYYQSIFNFIKHADFNMIYFEIEAQKEYKHINLCEGLNLYQTNIADVYFDSMICTNPPYYSMNDGAYCADINYLLNYIFDEMYFNCGSVYDCECYLQHKHNTILGSVLERMILNIQLFKRMSITGPASLLFKNRDIEHIEGLFGDKL